MDGRTFAAQDQTARTDGEDAADEACGDRGGRRGAVLVAFGRFHLLDAAARRHRPARRDPGGECCSGGTDDDRDEPCPWAVGMGPIGQIGAQRVGLDEDPAEGAAGEAGQDTGDDGQEGQIVERAAAGQGRVLGGFGGRTGR